VTVPSAGTDLPNIGPVALLDAHAVEEAAARLDGVVRHTPLEENERLSSATGTTVLVKREDVQLGRSYKVRGAYNLISSLTSDERALGVVCASAGNHAQGVAFACRTLEIAGRIYLPANTPRQKRDRVRSIGGSWTEVVVGGDTYDDANAAALAHCAESGAIYVHAFDDPRTIAGQGSVAVEITRDRSGPIGTVVVPVGGGGLAAGMATWLRSARPDVRIVGVEPEGAASMTAAIAHGAPWSLPQIDTFVDGAAVGRVGATTFPIVRDLVDEIVVVPEGAVATEMLDLYQTDGIIAEPAGALATTAARRYLALERGETVVCVLSGGNNDVSRYAEVIERSLASEGLRHYFLVTFPQEPGALRAFLDDVLVGGEDIVVFEYVKKNNRETGPALVGIELDRPEDIDGLLARMAATPLRIEPVPPASPLFTFLL
jgi:threonine dehydratase